MPGPGADFFEVGKSSGQGTVSPTTGTFTPSSDVDAVQVNDNLNPYIDAGPWGRVEISGMPLPGIIQSIDGADKPEDWSVQKGTAKSNATTVWKGTKLAESIKIMTALTNAEAFAQYYDIRNLLRPKIGVKPPSLLISSPVLNFSGITRIAIKNILPPKWVSGAGYWTGEIELIEFNPEKPANTGPAGGAKAWTEGTNSSDPNKDVKSALQKALDEAAKA